VFVRSEDWSAIAIDGYIDKGESVEVVGRDGIVLRVKRTKKLSQITTFVV